MSDGLINACSGNFYDSGGNNGGNHDDNESLVFTICPDSPNSAIQVNFTSFSTEAGYDTLFVINGDDIGDPLFGLFTGNSGPGVTTSTDASGCLTFYFVSDDSFLSST